MVDDPKLFAAVKQQVADLFPDKGERVHAAIARDRMKWGYFKFDANGNPISLGNTTVAQEVWELMKNPDAFNGLVAEAEVAPAPPVEKKSEKIYPGGRTLADVQQIKDPFLRVQVFDEGEGEQGSASGKEGWRKPVTAAPYGGLTKEAVEKMSPEERLEAANEAFFKQRGQ